MDKLYLKIIEEFENKKNLFIKYNVPHIRYIDLYRGQPLAPERFELYDIPALFLEYGIDWKTNILNLSVHVVCDSNFTTSNISPNKITGLEIFTLYKVVKEILQGLSCEDTGKLELVSERPAEADVVNYQIIDFTTSMKYNKLEDEFKDGRIEQIKTKKHLKYHT